MEWLELPPSAALLSATECFPYFEDLRRDFDYLVFLDFCTGLDALVLHDTLVTVGTIPRCSEHPLVDALQREGVLQLLQIHTGDPLNTAQTIMGHDRAKALMNIVPSTLAQGDGLNIWARAAAQAMTMHIDIVAEAETSRPFVASAQQLPIYLLLPDVQKETTAFRLLEHGLANKYNDFKNLLLDLRTQNAGESVRIPPLTLEALMKADSLESLPEVVLHLRDRYVKVRNFFWDIQETLAADDVPLAKKLKNQKKATLALGKLFKQSEIDGVALTTSFAVKANESIDVKELRDGAEWDDINYQKIIGYLLNKADAAYWKFRLRPLHATKRRYLKATDRDLPKVIQKHFGHELTRADLQYATQYEGLVAEYFKDRTKPAVDTSDAEQ